MSKAKTLKPIRSGRRLRKVPVRAAAQAQAAPAPKRIWRGAALGVLATSLASTMLSPVYAGPSGADVVSGDVGFSGPNGDLTITQGGQKAIINWQDFSIGEGERVEFVQPNANAVALNRVIGGNASQIAGSLTANGKVWLVNRNGVFFSKTATVDVNSLVATTTDIRDQDFLSNNFNFSIPSDNPNAQVVNEGRISVREAGLAGLVAPHVRNSGVIEGTLSTVIVGGAETFSIDFYGDGLINFEITGAVDAVPEGAEAVVQNTGTISNPGGTVLMSAETAVGVIDQVVNAGGTIEATTFAQEGGVIVLSSGDNGVTTVTGTVTAIGDDAGESGGTIKVLGDKVGVAGGAVIDASGQAGGGEVLVGGNFQGQGPEQNASRTFVAATAEIKADAIDSGDGGKVIVWANGHTDFLGTASANGGANGGDGGFIEVSGKDTLNYRGLVYADAPEGDVGTVLFDPLSITVIDGIAGAAGTDDGSIPAEANDVVAWLVTDEPALNATITSGALEAITANIFMQAVDITIDAALNFNSPSTQDFIAFNGLNSLTVNAPITLQSGRASLALIAGDFSGSTGPSGLGLLTINQSIKWFTVPEADFDGSADVILLGTDFDITANVLTGNKQLVQIAGQDGSNFAVGDGTNGASEAFGAAGSDDGVLNSVELALFGTITDAAQNTPNFGSNLVIGEVELGPDAADFGFPSFITTNVLTISGFTLDALPPIGGGEGNFIPSRALFFDANQINITQSISASAEQLLLVVSPGTSNLSGDVGALIDVFALTVNGGNQAEGLAGPVVANRVTLTFDTGEEIVVGRAATSGQVEIATDYLANFSADILEFFVDGSAGVFVDGLQPEDFQTFGGITFRNFASEFSTTFINFEQNESMIPLREVNNFDQVNIFAPLTVTGDTEVPTTVTFDLRDNTENAFGAGMFVDTLFVGDGDAFDNGLEAPVNLVVNAPVFQGGSVISSGDMSFAIFGSESGGGGSSGFDPFGTFQINGLDALGSVDIAAESDVFFFLEQLLVDGDLTVTSKKSILVNVSSLSEDVHILGDATFNTQRDDGGEFLFSYPFEMFGTPANQGMSFNVLGDFTVNVGVAEGGTLTNDDSLDNAVLFNASINLNIGDGESQTGNFTVFSDNGDILFAGGPERSINVAGDVSLTTTGINAGDGSHGVDSAIDFFVQGDFSLDTAASVFRIGGTGLQNFGQVSPGNFQVNGDLTFDGGAFFLFDAGAGGNSTALGFGVDGDANFTLTPDQALIGDGDFTDTDIPFLDELPEFAGATQLPVFVIQLAAPALIGGDLNIDVSTTDLPETFQVTTQLGVQTVNNIPVVIDADMMVSGNATIINTIGDVLLNWNPYGMGVVPDTTDFTVFGDAEFEARSNFFDQAFIVGGENLNVSGTAISETDPSLIISADFIYWQKEGSIDVFGNEGLGGDARFEAGAMDADGLTEFSVNGNADFDIEVIEAAYDRVAFVDDEADAAFVLISEIIDVVGDLTVDITLPGEGASLPLTAQGPTGPVTYEELLLAFGGVVNVDGNASFHNDAGSIIINEDRATGLIPDASFDVAGNAEFMATGFQPIDPSGVFGVGDVIVGGDFTVESDVFGWLLSNPTDGFGDFRVFGNMSVTAGMAFMVDPRATQLASVIGDATFNLSFGPDTIEGIDFAEIGLPFFETQEFFPAAVFLIGDGFTVGSEEVTSNLFIDLSGAEGFFTPIQGVLEYDRTGLVFEGAVEVSGDLRLTNTTGDIFINNDAFDLDGGFGGGGAGFGTVTVGGDTNLRADGERIFDGTGAIVGEGSFASGGDFTASAGLFGWSNQDSPGDTFTVGGELEVDSGALLMLLNSLNVEGNASLDVSVTEESLDRLDQSGFQTATPFLATIPTLTIGGDLEASMTAVPEVLTLPYTGPNTQIVVDTLQMIFFSPGNTINVGGDMIVNAEGDLSLASDQFRVDGSLNVGATQTINIGSLSTDGIMVVGFDLTISNANEDANPFDGFDIELNISEISVGRNTSIQSTEDIFFTFDVFEGEGNFTALAWDGFDIFSNDFDMGLFSIGGNAVLAAAGLHEFDLNEGPTGFANFDVHTVQIGGDFTAVTSNSFDLEAEFFDARNLNVWAGTGVTLYSFSYGGQDPIPLFNVRGTANFRIEPSIEFAGALNLPSAFANQVDTIIGDALPPGFEIFYDFDFGGEARIAGNFNLTMDPGMISPSAVNSFAFFAVDGMRIGGNWTITNNAFGTVDILNHDHDIFNFQFIEVGGNANFTSAFDGEGAGFLASNVTQLAIDLGIDTGGTEPIDTIPSISESEGGFTISGPTSSSVTDGILDAEVVAFLAELGVFQVQGGVFLNGVRIGGGTGGGGEGGEGGEGGGDKGVTDGGNFRPPEGNSSGPGGDQGGQQNEPGPAPFTPPPTQTQQQTVQPVDSSGSVATFIDMGPGGGSITVDLVDVGGEGPGPGGDGGDGPGSEEGGEDEASEGNNGGGGLQRRRRQRRFRSIENLGDLGDNDGNQSLWVN